MEAKGVAVPGATSPVEQRRQPKAVSGVCANGWEAVWPDRCQRGSGGVGDATQCWSVKFNSIRVSDSTGIPLRVAGLYTHCLTAAAAGFCNSGGPETGFADLMWPSAP